MGSAVTATFEVTKWDEAETDARDDAAKITQAVVCKTYSGEILGESVTTWLMAYAPDGTATFVGIERLVGSVSGRSGTLVLRHVGDFHDGAATAELTVLAGCGTGQLAGATGSGSFVADPAGSVSLDVSLG